MNSLTQQDFERLLEFRVTLRRFQRWSEDQAQAAGLTHAHLERLHELAVVLDDLVTRYESENSASLVSISK